MAQITFFHYVHRNTILHNMDGRVKVACMVFLSLATSLASGILGYGILTGIILTALLKSKLPFAALLKDMKLFGSLIFFVFIMNVISMKGEPIPYFPIKSISIEGVIASALFAWRMILIIMICSVITGTTSLMVFNKVIEWYLRPIPFVPETRVAAMINLTFVLIPVILDQYAEMMDAQKSRCVELRRNPIKRVMFIVFPLLSNTLRKTDELIFAMESRCYSEERTKPVFKTETSDWIVFLISLSAVVLVIVC